MLSDRNVLSIVLAYFFTECASIVVLRLVALFEWQDCGGDAADRGVGKRRRGFDEEEEAV